MDLSFLEKFGLKKEIIEKFTGSKQAKEIENTKAYASRKKNSIGSQKSSNKEATPEEIGVLKSFDGDILTAHGALEGTTEQKKITAYLSNGTFVVEIGKGSDLNVLDLEKRIKGKNMQIQKTLYVQKSVLRELYASFNKRRETNVNDNSVKEMANREIFFDIVRVAVKENASDIHIEVGPNEATVRIRVDGKLKKIGNEFESEQMHAVLSAIYSGSEGGSPTYQPLNFQEARLSADKCPSLPANVNAIRLQFNPFLDGRHFVGRILYHAKHNLKDIDELGYSLHQTKNARLMRRKPYGINVISGPTGSGKSTTLQTALTALIREEAGTINVMTIEDPPEYKIPGAIQLPVIAKDSAAKKEGFSTAIKAGMRSDPDVIMIGEVRDENSAHLAWEAAQTGHQVWCSVHANNAIMIMERLKGLGIEYKDLCDPDMITGLIGQRLMRKICPHCCVTVNDDVFKINNEFSEEHRISDEYLDIPFFKDKSNYLGMKIANLSGCSKCDRGYKGRTVVAETINPNLKFMDLLSKNKVDAINYWLAPKDDNKMTNGMGGCSLMDHAVTKLMTGMVDVRDLDKIGILEQYDMDRVKIVKNWIEEWNNGDKK